MFFMSQLYPAFVLSQNHLPQILQTGFNSVKLPDSAPLFTLPSISPYDIAVQSLLSSMLLRNLKHGQLTIVV